MRIIRPELLLLFAVFIACLGAGLLIGLRIDGPRAAVASQNTLRASGGKFTKPLLLTDFSDSASSSSLNKLKGQVENQLAILRKEGKIEVASVYFRQGGAQLLINPDQKYYPASLNKVPLMMAYFKRSEHDPALLTRRGMLDVDRDYNVSQEMAPSNFPVNGNEYSIDDLIEMMIVDSDNTSFNLLMSDPDTTNEMRKLFQELQLSYPYDQNDGKEVLTVQEYVRFFRVLRNATYINEGYSEKALELLSRAEYRNGIVAGVANDVSVAHKFGLFTHRNAQSGAVLERQLHDCGIVYHPQGPYLLCIMTKSRAQSLSDIEEAIKSVSSIIYQEVAKNE